MPDFYMHAKFAKDIADTMTQSLDETTLLLGAQGPDPFYYMVFDQAKADYRYYADRLHDTNTRQSLITLTNFVKTHQNQALFSFYIGYLCHYALDVSVHPYIYHHVGIYDENSSDTHNLRGLHLRFERAVDIRLLERDFKKPAHRVNVTQFFPTPNDNPLIEDAYKEMLKDTFNVSTPLSYTKASKAMKKTIRYAVQDRFGIKRFFFKGIDLFNKKTDLFLQDLSMHANPKTFDYLNLSHRTWHHPITNEIFHTSVLDCYDHAKKFLMQILDQVIPYIKGKRTIDLSTVFTNLSFNMGIDCDHGNDVKFLNIYNQK
ncbi:MAG: zinc dependent phospholipase C family protein [Candidatus Izimaplasma sp.]|nr:zinc dependent phospholipase C family protein [Candidatus Izimaplasma bacterium]